MHDNFWPDLSASPPHAHAEDTFCLLLIRQEAVQQTLGPEFLSLIDHGLVLTPTEHQGLYRRAGFYNESFYEKCGPLMFHEGVPYATVEIV